MFVKKAAAAVIISHRKRKFQVYKFQPLNGMSSSSLDALKASFVIIGMSYSNIFLNFTLDKEKSKYQNCKFLEIFMFFLGAMKIRRITFHRIHESLNFRLVKFPVGSSNLLLPNIRF